MKKLKAICCGYYGKGNGGDEALLATLLQMLPPHITPLVLSGNPKETQKLYNVMAYDRMNTWQVLDALKQSDVFIWGGGSLIQDSTSAISPLYYTGLMGLAQKMGLKTIAWAQGIGPLKRPLTRKIAERIFRGISVVSVRDRASAELLSNWQIPFSLAPDPVWALESSPVPGLWDLPAPKVAITLRQHPLLTPSRLQVLTRALVDFQKATKTFILLLPFQASQDLAIAQELHRHLGENSRVLQLENPRQLKGVFRGVEMAIGMRLHSLIMAAAEECRCFGLSYDPKVTQLMAELDIPGYELSEIPDNSLAISTAWIEHYANGEGLMPVQIKALIDRSVIHQEILHQL